MLQCFANFLNTSFLIDLFTNKARKLKVAESNQTKGGRLRVIRPTLVGYVQSFDALEVTFCVFRWIPN